MTAPKIMLAQEEGPLLTLLKSALESQGYQVEATRRDDCVEERLKETQSDLLVLESDRAVTSGFSVHKRLRLGPETQFLPIIILLSEGEFQKNQKGLTNADELLLKPFSVAEFVARVRALLRRTKPHVLADVLVIDDIVLDRQHHQVLRQGRPIHVGVTEFRLLDFMMQNPGRVLSRRELMNAIWNNSVYLEGRAVDVSIQRLRKALRTGRQLDLIKTIPGVGYAIGSEAGFDTHV